MDEKIISNSSEICSVACASGFSIPLDPDLDLAHVRSAHCMNEIKGLLLKTRYTYTQYIPSHVLCLHLIHNYRLLRMFSFIVRKRISHT